MNWALVNLLKHVLSKEGKRTPNPQEGGPQRVIALCGGLGTGGVCDWADPPLLGVRGPFPLMTGASVGCFELHTDRECTNDDSSKSL